MAKVRSWVGLDVHARSVVAVRFDGETGELHSRKLSVGTVRRSPGPTAKGNRPAPHSVHDRGSADDAVDDADSLLHLVARVSEVATFPPQSAH
jgi:hypothetical protein